MNNKITIYDILLSFASQCQQLLPELTHCMVDYEDSDNDHIIYSIGYNNSTRETYHLTQNTLDLHMTCILNDGLLKQIETKEKLSPFLNTFILNVNGRFLHFDCKTVFQDKIMIISTTFRFKEAVLLDEITNKLMQQLHFKINKGDV